MERTAGRLADGRQIIWYDADGTHRTAVADRRDLPTTVTGSQLRRDPLTGEWIAVASHRQSRTYLPPADECPLCPSDDHLSEIPSPEYQVVAFENRFPSYELNAEAPDATDGLDTASSASLPRPLDPHLEQIRAGRGRCEVVCFTSDHNASFAQLTPQQARLVVDTWADRTTDLNAIDSVQHVFPFENRGKEIGVTLQHPHGQIYAYPFIPPRAATELAHAQAYQQEHGRSLFGDIIASESAAGTRVIAENAEWIAFVPFAARWPIEVHFYPTRQVPDIPALDDAARDGFVEVYLDVLQRFDRLYDEPTPYIAAWQQAPAREHRDVAWLHLELYSIRRGEGKVKFLAGSESGQGAFVNDGLPEGMAQRLREA
ncbi:galactose-1-phosphate uridylyltransferase [Flexivirga oryzae]|uniref:Galactose-1-phosphate uridylyltransferase n=1 Tax=Flexivirga oryzae TaxID=1794944 RepID=A0A839NDC4_9MICO|nr:galactose-1-phosphate uridylyltransferase [Flexivirga oryzae]MBB2893964.1 UDPglucose--hexose-1-phosphate uridylyltransferase [Flexivirga oryzae]